MKNFTKVLLGTVLGVALVASSASASMSWSRSLKLGSNGADVKTLQQFLNMCADSQVSMSGAGAPGFETSHFGPATKAAVMKWQMARGVNPASGLFGPLSRAKAADLQASSNVCGGGVIITPPPVGQSGPVSASLSATTPAAGYIIDNQATAGLLDVTFTGSGVVNSVTLKRSGISDQNTLSNVYLYDGVTRLTDGYSFNSVGTITINNLNLMVNGSRTISIKADASSTASNNSTIAIALTSFSSGASVNTVNIQGNLMNLASGASLASLGLSGSNTVGSGSVNAGTTSYTVWRQAFQVNTRALWLKAANFRITGSAPSDALQNVGLYVDGVKAGNNAVMTMTNGSNYLSFDMSGAPLSLSTGSHTLEIRGDVVKGSSFSFTVSLQQSSDLMVMDPQVGVNVSVCGNTSCSTSFSASTGGLITIGSGSFTGVVDPTFSSLTNVTAGASNVTIAKFKLHGYGEDVKVTSLPITPVMTFTATTYSSGTVTAGSQSITVASTAGASVGSTVTIAGATAAVGTVTSVTSSTVFVATITTAGATPAGAVTFAHNGLQNVSLYFNGSQIGSQQSWPVAGGALTFNLGSQMLVPAGVDSTLEVRADLRTIGGTNYSAGSVSANLGAATAEGWNSHTSLTGPTATGTVLSLQSGTLGLSKNAGYANQNANPNTAGVKIGSFVMQNQSTSESIRVTSLLVNTAYGSTTSSSNFSGLRTSETSGNASIPQQPATAAASSNANNTFSSDFTLAPGAVKTIDIFADSGSDATSTTSTVITSLTVTSIGMTSNVSATSTATTGQTITFRTGTFGTPTIVTSNSTVAQLIAAANGGLSDGSKAVYNLTSANAGATVSELTFTVTSGSATSVKVNGVTAPVVAGVAYLTGLNIVVPNGGSGTNIDVYVSYPEVGTSGVTSFTTTSTLTLTTVKSTSGNTTTTSTVSVAAPQMTLVGSKPAFAVADSTDTLLNGSVKLAEVTVSADAKGDIKLSQLAILVNSTGVAAIASGSDNILVKDTSGATVATTNATFAVAAGGSGTGVICFDTATAACASGQATANGYLIPAGTSKTFRIYATASSVAGAVNTTSLSTKLGAAASTKFYDVAGGNSTAVAATLLYGYPTDTSVITN